MRLLGAAATFAFGSIGCIKEVSSDERLERATTKTDVNEALGATELRKIKFDETADALAKARNENKPETERVSDYTELYESLKSRSAKFEEAMTRNPDLAYQEGSQELVSAKEQCIQQQAEIRLEFERYVRELVDVPTVQEIKGGATVVVARLDFGTLKQAIEALNPDDRESLLTRVSTAERKVEVKAEPRKKK